MSPPQGGEAEAEEDFEEIAKDHEDEMQEREEGVQILNLPDGSTVIKRSEERSKSGFPTVDVHVPSSTKPSKKIRYSYKYKKHSQK
ncbi:MAG: hypothetical protein ACLFQ7_06955 [Phormidium sp.]